MFPSPGRGTPSSPRSKSSSLAPRACAKPKKRCRAGATGATNPLTPPPRAQSLSRHCHTCWQPHHGARPALTSHCHPTLLGASRMRRCLGPTRCSLAAMREGGCLPSKDQLQPLHAWLLGQQRQHLPKGRGDRPSRSRGTAGHGSSSDAPTTPARHRNDTGALPAGPFIAAEPLAAPSCDWVLGAAPAIPSAAIGCPPMTPSRARPGRGRGCEAAVSGGRRRQGRAGSRARGLTPRGGSYTALCRGLRCERVCR